jgi:Family of unknown function (DUF6483)
MIRNDYLLRMIQEFAEAIARIRSLKRGQKWNEASEALDEGFQKLMGAGADTIADLSDTELLARVASGESTQLVRHKTLVLVGLLAEAGDVATARDDPEAGRRYHLKALHLLLDALGAGEILENPEFVPKVEALAAALKGTELPVRTNLMLMQHYERTGEFAKAEDALFTVLEAEPDHPGALEFGMAFYRRLLLQSDAALSDGNLPRAEIEQAIKELAQRLEVKRP